jgi:hypothetical protein
MFRNKSFKEKALPPVEVVSDKSPSSGEFEGILDEKLVKMLNGAGLTTPAQVLEAGEEGLLAIKGIGRSTAEKILDACEEAAS